VAFVSRVSNLVSGDTNDTWDVFVHDRQSGQTTRVSAASDGAQGNGWSAFPSISADGRYVAFVSRASNLVSGDTNDTWDVFVHDRQSGQTTRVSAASDGAQGNGWSAFPSISADGRYVAFVSRASNLVSGDTNDTWDVFVHDRGHSLYLPVILVGR
jgi:Tol biopolymer transport system component